PWRVSFPANFGAPSEITLPALQAWTRHADEGVRYFSGTATYTKSVYASREWLRPAARTFLDLGGVADMAEVSVNGKPMGLLWKPPYRVDVTAALRVGRNEFAIKVT